MKTNQHLLNLMDRLARSFLPMLMIGILTSISSHAFSQAINVTATWEREWGPTDGTNAGGLGSGPNPIGFDTAVLPNTPQRFGTARLVDLDGDGDLDMVSGSNRGTFHYYQNTGTPTAPHYALTVGAIPSLDTIDIGFLQNTNEVRPSFADLDADGDLDMLVGSRWNYIGLLKLDDLHFFRNTGSATNPIFVADTIPGLADQQCGEFSSPAFGDLDGDGDLDFITGGSDSCTYFENVGTATNPSYVREFGATSLFPPLDWVEISFLAPTVDLEDFDNDGDLDMYFMNEAGFIRYIPNHGTPTVPDFAPYISYPAHSFDTTDFGAFGSMDFEDINGDGVKDLVATHWNPTYWFWYSGVNAGAIINLTEQQISCNGANNAYITASLSAGDPPYTLLWSNGATTDSIGGLAAGTYTLTVTDSTGNVTVDSVTIIDPALLVASTTVNNNVSCNGFADASATASATGGTSPFSYNWNTGATTATISSMGPGTYSVTITDANGCTDSASVSLTEPAALIASTVLDSNDAGNGGGATAIATGGTSPFSYAWNTGFTNASITGVPANTYSVTITDANGCTDSASVVVLAGPAVSVVIDSNVTCNSFIDGGATANVSGGTAPYTYAWSNSASTASITGVGAGTYTVTVTDNIGLTAVGTGTVTEPAVLVSATVVDSNVSCFGFLDGGATASATGGTMPYDYAWSNNAITASITGVAAGTYSVTITDANGCTDSTSVTITEPVVLVASAVEDSMATCNSCADGGASASATGGTMPYTYNWSNSATTASITGVLAGTYSVTITDANGCTDSASVTINAGPNPTAVADSNVSCNGFSDGGASLTLVGGTAPFTYLWSNGGTTTSITGLVTGTYTVTVTDNNGLTGTSSVTITEPAVLVSATTLDSNVSCKSFLDGGATASASGGTTAYSYSWNNGATTASITGVAAGTYSVTITDANGCTDSSSITITEPDSIIFSLTSLTDASCAGEADGSFIFSITGGTPFSTAGGNYLISPPGFPVGAVDTATGIAADTIAFLVTDSNQCLSDTVTLIVTEPDTLVLTTVTDSNVTCNGLSDGGATASSTGGTMPYSYSWSNGATTASITGLIAGSYTVTVTDANGCSDVSTATITEPALLVAATVVDSNVSCNSFLDGGATASATGGTMPYSYSWSNSATTASITGVAAGTYTVTITDANGCTDSTSVSITEPAPLVAASVVDSNVTCFGFANGGATASATGGTMPYDYAWSNSAITASITGVVSGTYSVTITDANGCTDSSASFISEPALLVGTIDAPTFIGGDHISCNGADDGVINYFVTGGTMPYSYNWSASNSFTSTSQNLSSLEPGFYLVTLTDANGCTDAGSVTLNEPAALTSSLTESVFPSGDNISCEDAADGTIDATITGGHTGYSYSWTGPNSFASSDQNLNSLDAGTYTVVVTDTNGCTITDSTTLTQPDSLLTTLTAPTVAGGVNITCFGETDGSIDLALTGGSATFTYSWSGPNSYTSTMQDIDTLGSGMYNVTVTDINSCTATNSIQLTEPALLVGTLTAPTFIGGDHISCNGADDGVINYAVVGGTMTYSYSWTGPNSFASTNQNLTNLEPGLYEVLLTDANGCADSAMVTLTEPAALASSLVPSAFPSGDQISCKDAEDGTIDASTTGGHAGYSYNWTGPNSFASMDQNLSALDAGTYHVTMTDTNGCTVLDSITLVEPDSLLTALSSPTVIGGFNISCFAGTDGSIDLSLTGGSSTFTYSWNGPNGYTNASQDPNNVEAGTYTVTVTDVNGCTAIDSIGLTEPAAPVAIMLTAPEFVGGNEISCYGFFDGAINNQTSGGTAGYDYQWSGPNGYSSTDESISALEAGVYTLMVNDTNGCQEMASITLTEPDTSFYIQLDPLVYTGNVNILCNGTFTGEITLTELGGGQSGFTYAWTGPNGYTSGAQSPNGLEAGAYQVLVTDTNNCMAMDSVTLIEPSAVVVTIDSTEDVTCRGDSDGAAFGSNEGGIEPRAFSWSNGSTTNAALALSEGVVMVTVTDGQGCTATNQATIGFVHDLPVIDLGADIVTDSNAVELNVPAGWTNFEWDNGSNSLLRVVFQSGTYELFVTDSNGCTNSDTITVSLWPTGLEEIEAGQSMKIFPNPSAGIITLETAGFNQAIEQWEVYTINGVQVRRGAVRQSVNTSLSLDLTDLAGGTYFIRVLTPTETLTAPIIIR